MTSQIRPTQMIIKVDISFLRKLLLLHHGFESLDAHDSRRIVPLLSILQFLQVLRIATSAESSNARGKGDLLFLISRIWVHLLNALGTNQYTSYVNATSHNYHKIARFGCISIWFIPLVSTDFVSWSSNKQSYQFIRVMEGPICFNKVYLMD